MSVYFGKLYCKRDRLNFNTRLLQAIMRTNGTMILLESLDTIYFPILFSQGFGQTLNRKSVSSKRITMLNFQENRGDLRGEWSRD